MEYRHLGNSGLRVSILSFGAWVNWDTKNEDNAVRPSPSSFTRPKREMARGAHLRVGNTVVRVRQGGGGRRLQLPRQC